jgi:hypothetical protein
MAILGLKQLLYMLIQERLSYYSKNKVKKKTHGLGQVLWCTPIIPASRQRSGGFQVQGWQGQNMQDRI